MINDHPCSPLNLAHEVHRLNEQQYELFMREASQWRCECGEYCTPTSPLWRNAGSHWEHYHGFPIGHVAAHKLGSKAA